MGQDVFEELIIADNKLPRELENPGDHYKILDNFAKRVNLYTRLDALEEKISRI